MAETEIDKAVGRGMATEIIDAHIARPGEDLPHGVIGMFLKSQIDELEEGGVMMSQLT